MNASPYDRLPLVFSLYAVAWGHQLANDQTPVSPYLNQRLRTIEEAEEDLRRFRSRERELEMARLKQRPSAEIIPFPKR